MKSPTKTGLGQPTSPTNFILLFDLCCVCTCSCRRTCVPLQFLYYFFGLQVPQVHHVVFRPTHYPLEGRKGRRSDVQVCHQNSVLQGIPLSHMSTYITGFHLLGGWGEKLPPDPQKDHNNTISSIVVCVNTIIVLTQLLLEMSCNNNNVYRSISCRQSELITDTHEY